jgi:hypothetical protein
MTPTAVLARADEPGSSAGTRSLPVVAAAAVLIAAQLGLRAWAAAPGYFLLDDFVFVDRAVRGPLDLAGLLTDYNGHLMPGAFLLVDALTTLTPLSWPATVGLLLLGQLAVDVALLRLLLTLFGRRPAVLLALAVYLASAITLPAFLWWAAALNQLPLQLAVVLALTAHVRYLRSGRRQDAVAAAAAVVGGLLFSEKAVLALPLLAAVTLLWFGRGRGVARVAHELRRHRFGWTLHGLIGAGFTAFYLLTVPSPVRGLATAGEAAVLIGSAVRHSVLPGLVGGPWRWEDFPPTLALTDPPGWAQVLAAVAVAAVVAATMVRRRGAGRAWALLAVTVIGSCLLLAVSRAQVIGPYPLAREYRYFTETALVGALCLALATLPVLGAPQVLRERPGPLAATLRRWTAAPGLRLGLGTAVVLALAGGVGGLHRGLRPPVGGQPGPAVRGDGPRRTGRAAGHRALRRPGARRRDVVGAGRAGAGLAGARRGPAAGVPGRRPVLPRAGDPRRRRARAVRRRPGDHRRATGSRAGLRLVRPRTAGAHPADRADATGALGGADPVVVGRGQHRLGQRRRPPGAGALPGRAAGGVPAGHRLGVGGDRGAGRPGAADLRRGGRRRCPPPVRGRRVSGRASGAPGERGHEFPCLDGLRGLAAAAVVVTHCAFVTGGYTAAFPGPALARLDVAVAVFFVLAGFLLSLPMFRAAAGTAPPRRTAAYLWRRALRILPAYWAAVAVALLLLPANRDAGPADWAGSWACCRSTGRPGRGRG